MKRTGLVCIIAIAVFGVWIGSSIATEDMRIVDNSVFEKTTRAAARFEHDLHNENSQLDDCIACHHVYEDGVLIEDESSEDLRCVECHDNSKDGPELSLRKAYHKNCKGCHLALKAGPILCGECHKKGEVQDGQDNSDH